MLTRRHGYHKLHTARLLGVDPVLCLDWADHALNGAYRRHGAKIRRWAHQ